MSPVVVTYIGFVVAILILLWGLFVVGKRYFVRRRDVSSKNMGAWVPLKTTATESPEDSFTDLDEDDQDEGSRADLPARARQNGHYSGSKKMQ
jgi:hypothetical protein